MTTTILIASTLTAEAIKADADFVVESEDELTPTIQKAIAMLPPEGGIVQLAVRFEGTLGYSARIEAHEVEHHVQRVWGRYP